MTISVLVRPLVWICALNSANSTNLPTHRSIYNEKGPTTTLVQVICYLINIGVFFATQVAHGSVLEVHLQYNFHYIFEELKN